MSRRELHASAMPFVPGQVQFGIPGPFAPPHGPAFGISPDGIQMVDAGGMQMHAPAMMMQTQQLANAVIEMYDAEVKANVNIPADCVFPSYGVMAAMQQMGRGAAKPKVCTGFVSSGLCRLGETCRDIHPAPHALMAERSRIYNWMHSKEAEFMNQPSATYKVFYSDLKEVISVPASALVFTRGLFLDPMDREKRPSGAGGNARTGNPTVAQQAPTACGLFASNPASCKWGRFCNQAHVSSAWIEDHRRQFEVWASTLEGHFNLLPEDASFTIHDPLRRALIRVPKTRIAFFTRGLLQGTTDKCPSVCLLSLNGRCTAGARCNQAHVDPQWLSEQTDQSESMIESTAGGIGNASTTTGHSSRNHSEILHDSRQASMQSITNGSSPALTAPRGGPAFSADDVSGRMQVQAQYPRPGAVSGASTGYFNDHPSQQSAPRRGVTQLDEMALAAGGPMPPNMMGQRVPGDFSLSSNPPSPGFAAPGPAQMQSRFSQNPPSKPQLLQTPSLAGALAPATPPDAGLPAPFNPQSMSPIRPPPRAPVGVPNPAGFQLPYGYGREPTPPYGQGTMKTPDLVAGAGFALPPFEAPSTPNVLPRTPNTGSVRALNFSFPAPQYHAPISPLIRSAAGPNAMRVSLSGFEDVIYRATGPGGMPMHTVPPGGLQHADGQHFLDGPGDSLTSLPPSLVTAQRGAGHGAEGSQTHYGSASIEAHAGASVTSPIYGGNSTVPEASPPTPLALKSPARGVAPRNPRFSPAVRPSLVPIGGAPDVAGPPSGPVSPSYPSRGE